MEIKNHRILLGLNGHIIVIIIIGSTALGGPWPKLCPFVSVEVGLLPILDL